MQRIIQREGGGDATLKVKCSYFVPCKKNCISCMTLLLIILCNKNSQQVWTACHYEKKQVLRNNTQT